ncbi:peptidoglycan endopeptidase [Erythrobacter sp. SDW2]|uniref:peptidoglycan endopeptidase n=1 Tax=Erythrobacter sp. SDW2 TaxID=2907154 RepID=UPI001F19EAB2|nr:peptidoglycan endopeptidase [Erythrobacter sp. SDW2]UIP07143.1 peptidoglycan endopeptidase [Erythrobacter sp. SDW2]
MAAHARTLIGSRFRLHGRDPATGLDCVGVVAACLKAAGRPIRVPPVYGLRNTDIAPLLGLSERADAKSGALPCQSGDILLVWPGPAQHHLLLAAGPHSFIHAHATLRRVVETPFPAPWPIERHWRLT